MRIQYVSDIRKHPLYYQIVRAAQALNYFDSGGQMYIGFLEYIKESIFILNGTYKSISTESKAIMTPDLSHEEINPSLDRFMKTLLVVLLKKVEILLVNLEQKIDINQLQKETIEEYQKYIPDIRIPSPPLTQESFPFLETNYTILNNSQRLRNMVSISTASNYSRNNALIFGPNRKILSKQAQILSSQKSEKRKSNFDQKQLYILKTWIEKHVNHPYPSISEKEHLIRDSGLTIHQLNNWFINARRRLVPRIMKKLTEVQITSK